MMNNLVVTLAIIIGLSSAAWAWSEPTGFHGAVWGASVDDVREMLIAARTHPSEAFCFGQVCVWDTTVATVPARLSFEFDDDKLVRGIVRFSAEDYPAIVQSFIDRYGEPTDRRKPAVGADSPQSSTRLEWRGRSVVITLERPKGGGAGRATVVRREALKPVAEPPARTLNIGSGGR